jgi:hypothetical protein
MDYWVSSSDGVMMFSFAKMSQSKEDNSCLWHLNIFLTVYTHLIYEEYGYIYMPRDIADILT